MPPQRALVIGRTGQVARSLAAIATSSSLNYHFADRSEANLLDRKSLLDSFAKFNPHICINCAAYTAVDRAESEYGIAAAVNATGVGWLAEICEVRKVPLIHLSTDCVFNGRSVHPYPVDAPIDPINAYGASKAAGETALKDRLGQYVIVRLAWVFSEYGHNFLQIMLRLGREKNLMNIVSDQIGPPSYAYDIAVGLDRIAAFVLANGPDAPWGTYHMTNSGATSRFGFAEEIFRLAEIFGYPKVRLHPVASTAFSTPARRPGHSLLDCTKTDSTFGIKLRPWQAALRDCIEKISVSPNGQKGVA